MPRILYHDGDLIAVHKPSGQFVHATDLNRADTVPLLQEVRDAIGAWIYPIHRLDRATSGIVLFALSPEVAAAMSRRFSERLVQKRYLALVRGFCPDCVIDRPLKRKDSSKRQTPAAAQDAVTNIECSQQFEFPAPSRGFETTRCSLVSAVPATGRYHQIRRHLNGISHPVLGDTSHGDTRCNHHFRELIGLTRLLLAAVSLQFGHPVTGTAVCLECEPDDDFRNVVARLQPFGCSV